MGMRVWFGFYSVDCPSITVCICVRRWVEGLGLQLLVHAVKVFEVDVVLVMKHDRLYADLIATLSKSIAVINLPRSGGALWVGCTWRLPSLVFRKCKPEYLMECSLP